MQMIARIIRQPQALRMAGVSHDFIEVQDGVEMPRSANPLIDSLPISFVAQPRVIVIRSCIRKNGRANHFDALSMGSNDDLFVRALEAVKQGGMVRRSDLTGTRKSAQVVDTLQDDQIANARLGKYVAIETRQGIGPQAVRQQIVSADSLIQDAERAWAQRG